MTIPRTTSTKDNINVIQAEIPVTPRSREEDKTERNETEEDEGEAGGEEEESKDEGKGENVKKIEEGEYEGENDDENDNEDDGDDGDEEEYEDELKAVVDIDSHEAMSRSTARKLNVSFTGSAGQSEKKLTNSKSFASEEKSNRDVVFDEDIAPKEDIIGETTEKPQDEEVSFPPEIMFFPPPLQISLVILFPLESKTIFDAQYSTILRKNKYFDLIHMFYRIFLDFNNESAFISKLR